MGSTTSRMFKLGKGIKRTRRWKTDLFYECHIILSLTNAFFRSPYSCCRSYSILSSEIRRLQEGYCEQFGLLFPRYCLSASKGWNRQSRRRKFGGGGDFSFFLASPDPVQLRTSSASRWLWPYGQGPSPHRACGSPSSPGCRPGLILLILAP